MNDRERQIMRHILRHTEEVLGTVKRFDASKEKFMSDYIFYNACAMAIFQIGELSHRMPDTFKKAHAGLPWAEMRGMRNLFAHEYESVNKEIVWDTIQNDIPVLYEKLQSVYQSDTLAANGEE